MNDEEDLWLELLAQAQDRREMLLVWLAQLALRDERSLEGIGENLGLSRYAMLKLFDGELRQEGLSDSHYRAAATLLGIHVVLVKAAAGLLAIEDFYDPATLREHVREAQSRHPVLRGAHGSVALFANLLTNHAPIRSTLRNRFHAVEQASQLMLGLMDGSTG